ncbi:hypothetical protein LC607_29870 [Nostoc sp. CHAB 5824]|nr:hypothetical protein [Nostoc sp. CHAB 5824]
MQTNILFSELTTCEEANLSGGTYKHKEKEEKKYEKKYEKKHGKKYEKDDDDYGYGDYVKKYLDKYLTHLDW